MHGQGGLRRGLPYEIGEIGIGHKLRGVAGRYINLSDDQIRDVFKKMEQFSNQNTDSFGTGK